MVTARSAGSIVICVFVIAMFVALFSSDIPVGTDMVTSFLTDVGAIWGNLPVTWSVTDDPFGKVGIFPWTVALEIVVKIGQLAPPPVPVQVTFTF